MATSVTVQSVYNQVSMALMEPYNDGAGPGLSLGTISLSDFLQIFGAVLQEFVERSGMVWNIFTQPVQAGASAYLSPNDIDDLIACFVGGVYISHETLATLDDWMYQWAGVTGQPLYWHEDGLPVKTIELAPTPNYNGASYIVPTDPTLQPPFGIYNSFNLAEPGLYTGTVSTDGVTTTVTWNSGSYFDTHWASYTSPPLTISIVKPSGGVRTVDILAVSDATHLTGSAVINANVNQPYTVSVRSDGNLTMVGTKGLATSTFVLGDTIPIVPDSFCPYLVYGCLERIWSTNGENLDESRAQYARGRYLEGITVSSAIGGRLLEGAHS